MLKNSENNGTEEIGLVTPTPNPYYLVVRHLSTIRRIRYTCNIFFYLATTLLTHVPHDKMAPIMSDDIFNYIFVNENDSIPIQISLKYVPRSPIDNKPALVQVMAWHQSGDKPLPVPMMTQYIDAYMRH